MSLLEVNKITPQSGTTLTLGDSGDTINFGSGVLPNFENLTVTGDLTVDTNSLYVDSTNNRVGIGTASPSGNLHVEGTNVETFFIGTGSSKLQLKAGNSSNSFIEFGDTDDGNVGRLLYAHADNSMRFDVNASERMRIDSSGNVGINTTSPATFGKLALQVAGTTTPTNATNVGPSSINLYAAANGSSTNSTVGIFGWQAGQPGIGSGIGFSRENSVDWGSQIRFYTHPTTTSNISDITERMRIDSSGRVGIGTNSPSSFSSGAYNLVISQPSGSNAGITINNDGANTGSIFFANGTSETAKGRIRYDHSDDHLEISTVDTERMRIDSSGNVLVGTTSSSIYNDTSGNGIQLNGGTGQIVVAKESTSSADPALWLNNTGVGGNIVTFAKDGSSVGSIYSRFGTTLGINGGTTFTIGSNSNSDVIYVDFIGPPKAVYANPDNTYDLGTSSKRWQDLYLSGSVYLGGTGSANALDDYEEGTWTPVVTGGVSVTSANYVKIGRFVHVNFEISATSNNSGDFSGLPFTWSGRSAGIVGYQNDNSSTWSIVTEGTTGFSFRAGSTQQHLEAGEIARCSLMYMTA